MSDYAIYLRDQAAKCERHANAISDDMTQFELRKLAAEYVEMADGLEGPKKPTARSVDA